jgi:hypothetical protein
LGKRIRIRIRVKSWIRDHIYIRIKVKRRILILIRLEVKIQELRRLIWSQGEPRTLTLEAWRLKMEPWRVCMRDVVAFLHHSDEEQDPDPYQG